MNLNLLINMMLSMITLFLLGLCGWTIFRILRLPVPALLGTIVVIGTLRILQFKLETSPEFLTPLIQLLLGLYVGTRLTREAILQLKKMLMPAIIIVTWALAIVFTLGIFLNRVTGLNLYTALLSSSMGGLPEMTMIALVTDADVEIVIIMQLIRAVSTAVIFPIILKILDKENHIHDESKLNSSKKIYSSEQLIIKFNNFSNTIKSKDNYNKYINWIYSPYNKKQLLYGISTLLIALIGGILFYNSGVPAGAMIGSMLFVATASLTGVKVKSPPSYIFNVMMVGMGIIVSDNITADTLKKIGSSNLLYIIAISTAVIFLSSLLVALLIKRLTNWDFATSFLAAAPGGFTVMTMLAIKYDKDPLRVSILHLCRLVALKTIIPLILMHFI